MEKIEFFKEIKEKKSFLLFNKAVSNLNYEHIDPN